MISAGVVLGLVITWVTFSVNTLVLPRTDAAPEHVDVIFVLGPPTPTRIALAERMMAAGVSDNLMLSVPVAGPNSVRTLPACIEKRSYNVYCEQPKPFTTQGEARYLKRLSAARGWRSAIVITFTPQVSRARTLIQRCYAGDVSIISDEESISIAKWGYEMFYQTGAYVKALFNPGC